MSDLLTDRLRLAMREELVRTLGALCHEVGAAESSILLPRNDTELVFFASTKPALTQPDAPSVPIVASFSGVAYRTGQTIALADAASQASHFKGVDAVVGSRTREFVAVPLAERTVLGVLTLVNREVTDATESLPFGIAELRRAEAQGIEIARAIALLPGLIGIAPHEQDLVETLGAEFAGDLALLNHAEQRIAHAVVSALLQNRPETE